MTYPLVVVYGRLARYDKANGAAPFSGAPGAMFKHRTIDLLDCPCEIRVMNTPDMLRPFPPQSRVVLLGEDALALATGDTNLNKHRGYCLTVTSPGTLTQHAAIATYHPIDCWDFTRVEGDDDNDDENGSDESKDVAGTKRANFFAWALRDFWKLVHHAKPNWVIHPLPLPSYEPAEHDYVATWLRSLPPETRLVLDIECRIQDHSLDVIGLRANGRAFVVPFYLPSERIAFRSYESLGRFWRALAETFLRPDIVIVGHNLSFDLAVLAVHSGLPIPLRLYDTMIAMHRLEPLMEKSLSHAISFFLRTPRNHKADICPNTSQENFTRLCQYNSEDLIRTEQLRLEQLRLTEDQPERRHAIDTGNELLHVTMMMSLTGIPTCETAIAAAKEAHELRAEQYRRIAACLTNRPEFNPASPEQVADFFYRELNYPVMELTDSGQPATGAKALYELQLAQNNPVIPVIIEHREAKKASTSMDFKPLTLKSI